MGGVFVLHLEAELAEPADNISRHILGAEFVGDVRPHATAFEERAEQGGFVNIRAVGDGGHEINVSAAVRRGEAASLDPGRPTRWQRRAIFFGVAMSRLRARDQSALGSSADARSLVGTRRAVDAVRFARRAVPASGQYARAVPPGTPTRQGSVSVPAYCSWLE